MVNLHNVTEKMKTEDRIKSMLKVMSEGIYEKEHILAMALLSAVAGESVFLLGPPGTAKSLVARRLKLAFKDANAFEYLMSRFSTPDEIFGPVSISLLKNEDRYERVVDGFLPTATVVFLDEIWKASPSIQNALLTAINERIFQNGRNTLSLPMKALIAASNELPAEDEGLEALWDRFLVRMVSNCIQTESTFYKMLRLKLVGDITMPSDLQITDEVYESWQHDINLIAISDDVCKSISAIRKRLREEGKMEDHKTMDYYVSDRRWKKCVHLMQTAAFLNGRETIDVTDIPILFHCLWNTVEALPSIIDIVASSLTADLELQMARLHKEIDSAIKTKPLNIGKEGDARSLPGQFASFNYFYYSVLNFPRGRCLFYKADYKNLDDSTPTEGILYFDSQKKVWIIHALNHGVPFDYKPNNAQIVRKIEIQKCRGGITVDETPYAFQQTASQSVPSPTSNEEHGLFSGDIIAEPSIADIALSALQQSIMPNLAKLQETFAASKHLFLSADDKKIVKKHLDGCDKRAKELEVKIKNAQQLL